MKSLHNPLKYTPFSTKNKKLSKTFSTPLKIEAFVCDVMYSEEMAFFQLHGNLVWSFKLSLRLVIKGFDQCLVMSELHSTSNIILF